MSFYALRVKTVLGDECDHPYGFAEMGVDKGWWKRDSKEYEYMPDRLKCTLLSHRNLGQLVDLLLGHDERGFDIFWGVSDNDGIWVDLSHTQKRLGYKPQDNGAEWDIPPK